MHHVDHLDVGEDDFRACCRLEAEHGTDTAFDAPMVSLDPVVEILALADDDTIGLVLAFQRLSQETSCRWRVTVLRKNSTVSPTLSMAR